MKLTQQENLILAEAREFYGKRWRLEVWGAWVTGNYKGFPKASELQLIRNSAARTWDISRVKLLPGKETK